MPSSREQTETLYVERMAVAYSPGVPRDQVTAAKAEYCDFLTRYDPAVLARAWELTRERHAGKFWPSMSEARAFCEAAARQNGASGYSPATQVAETTYQRSVRAHSAIKRMAEDAAERHYADCRDIAARYDWDAERVQKRLAWIITNDAWEPVSEAVVRGEDVSGSRWTVTDAQWASLESYARSDAYMSRTRKPAASPAEWAPRPPSVGLPADQILAALEKREGRKTEAAE